MAYNKIVLGEGTEQKVLLDLTSDTVTPEALLNGYTAHDKSGEIIKGSFVAELFGMLNNSLQDFTYDATMDGSSTYGTEVGKHVLFMSVGISAMKGKTMLGAGFTGAEVVNFKHGGGNSDPYATARQWFQIVIVKATGNTIGFHSGQSGTFILSLD